MIRKEARYIDHTLNSTPHINLTWPIRFFKKRKRKDFNFIITWQAACISDVFLALYMTHDAAFPAFQCCFTEMYNGQTDIATGGKVA